MNARRFLLSPLSAFVLGGLVLPQLAQAAPPPVRVAQQQADWQMFSSQEGRFEILMPGQPEKTTQPLNTRDGAYDIHMVTAEEQGNGYMVMYSDYLDALVNRETPTQTLQQWQSGFVNAMQGRVTNQRSINLNSYRGREIEYETNNGLVGKARFFLVDGRLYQVVVMSSQGRSGGFNRNANRFLESFVLRN